MDPAARPSLPWRAAMATALYGPDGFYTRPGSARGGAGHFRTSAHASPLFANAMLRVVAAVDEAMGRPDPLDIVDIGAGGGHLLRRIAELAPTYLASRMDLTAVELAPSPRGLPDHIAWTDSMPPPGTVAGLVLATEWLDNVPLDLAVAGDNGALYYALVDPVDGVESRGEPLSERDLGWASTWWLPDSANGWSPGCRIEIGVTRDDAWAQAVTALHAGVAIAVDYGHTSTTRPDGGTLTGFYAGRSAPAIPDGSRDVTAHVAIDAARAAGEVAAGQPGLLLTQREALARLGVNGARPSLDLAHRDPGAYIRGLSGAAQAVELTDPAGLGAHYWIVQPVGLPLEALPPGLTD